MQFPPRGKISARSLLCSEIKPEDILENNSTNINTTCDTFKAIGSFVTNYVAFDHTRGKINGGILRGTVTTVDETADLFEVGVTGFETCIMQKNVLQSGENKETVCTFDVTDSGKIYSQWKGALDDNQTTILGGTGKYEHIAGECSKSITDSLQNNVIMAFDCSWRMP